MILKSSSARALNIPTDGNIPARKISAYRSRLLSGFGVNMCMRDEGGRSNVAN